MAVEIFGFSSTIKLIQQVFQDINREIPSHFFDQNRKKVTFLNEETYLVAHSYNNSYTYFRTYVAKLD